MMFRLIRGHCAHLLVVTSIMSGLLCFASVADRPQGQRLLTAQELGRLAGSDPSVRYMEVYQCSDVNADPQHLSKNNCIIPGYPCEFCENDGAGERGGQYGTIPMKDPQAIACNGLRYTGVCDDNFHCVPDGGTDGNCSGSIYHYQQQPINP